jgi:WhiB family transcriptional regulator, redox-sensing transcriptional regulator
MNEPAFTQAVQAEAVRAEAVRAEAVQAGTVQAGAIEPGTGLAGTGQAGQGDWRSLSACRHADPELFFPVVESGPGLVQLEAAKAVCARCDVRAECLSFATATVQDHGVWGGTSEEERRAVRSARLRQSRTALAGQDRPGERPDRAGRPRREPALGVSA